MHIFTTTGQKLHKNIIQLTSFGGTQIMIKITSPNQYISKSINQSINHLFDSDHLGPYTQNTETVRTH